MPPIRSSRKKSNRNNSNSNNNHNPSHNTTTQGEDRHRSFEDWGSLAVETLRLKLDQYNLVSTGKKATLQTRLYKHFHPNEPQQQHDNSTPSDLTDLITQIQLLRSEVNDIRENNHRYHEQTTSSSQHQLNPDPEGEEEGETREIPREIPPTFVRRNTEPKQRNSCNRNITPLSLPQDQDDDQTNHSVLGFCDNTNTLNNSTGMINSFQNPYAPPALKASVLTKIKKAEYVDFDNILPPPPNINNNSGELLGFHFDSDNNLLLKPNQIKAKIRDFLSWICAWNIFYQTTLHFFPQLHFELFSYLKIMCNFARKHKFTSFYAYDKSQRQTIAAQHNLPKHQKTTSWTAINEELFNNFLRDSHLPSCYHCATFGHYATACPYKSNTRNNYNRYHSNNSPYTYIADHNNTPSFRNDSPHQLNRQTNNTTTNRQQTYSTASNQNNEPEICHRFNHNNGACNKPPCRNLHICNKCLQPGHPGSRCTNSTRTSFRPSTS